MARSTSSSTATCTTGTPARRTGCRAPSSYAKGWIDCFHAYQGLGPPETHWTIEHFQKVSEDDLMKDVFEDGLRRRGDLPADVPAASGTPTGFNTTERNGALAEKHPGKFIVNTRCDPRDGDAGLKELEENVERWGRKGVKLYTAEWNNGSRGWTLNDPEAYRFLEKCAGARDQEHPRPQGPDDLAAGQGRVRRLRRRPRGDRLPGAELHRRARRAARGSRTSASWRPRSPTSTPACRWSSAA